MTLESQHLNPPDDSDEPLTGEEEHAECKDCGVALDLSDDGPDECGHGKWCRACWMGPAKTDEEIYDTRNDEAIDAYHDAWKERRYE